MFAILALLVSLAVPRYWAHVERAKEATLKQDLNTMRDAIDKFTAGFVFQNPHAKSTCGCGTSFSV